MGPEIQLANYCTTAFVHFTLAVTLFYALFVSVASRQKLSTHAWWVLFGIMLDTFSWGVHQSFFAVRWYLHLIGSDLTYKMVENIWLLTPSYMIGWLGVVITTTSFWRGNFVKNAVLKLAIISGWWVLVWITIRGL